MATDEEIEAALDAAIEAASDGVTETEFKGRREKKSSILTLIDARNKIEARTARRTSPMFKRMRFGSVGR